MLAEGITWTTEAVSTSERRTISTKLRSATSKKTATFEFVAVRILHITIKTKMIRNINSQDKNKTSVTYTLGYM
jgi:hypothetical protein